MSNGTPRWGLGPQMVMYGVSTVDDGELQRRLLGPYRPTFTFTPGQIPRGATIDELEALTKRVEALEQAIVKRVAKRAAKRKARR